MISNRIFDKKSLKFLLIYIHSLLCKHFYCESCKTRYESILIRNKLQLLGNWSVLYAWHLHINNKVPILISNRWEQTIICTNDLLKKYRSKWFICYSYNKYPHTLQLFSYIWFVFKEQQPLQYGGIFCLHKWKKNRYLITILSV